MNFDESEPGTCNNRELVERDPHRLLEGTAIAALAIGCRTAFIYVRGEYLAQSEILEKAIGEAYDAGFFGEGHRRAATSTSTSCCTGARAPTSAARRPRS